MLDSYLKFARQIIETRGRPMSAQQILNDAQRFGLLPEHLFGQTMSKTLQARIAEDIFHNRSKSLFYRTNLGTYFLRELSKDKSLPKEIRSEFPTRGRMKPLPDDRILFVRNKPISKVVRFFDKIENCFAENTDNAYCFIGQQPNHFLPIITFSILKYNNQILLHNIGKYSHFSDLVGFTSIGFRRFIDEFDIDFFATDKIGAELSSSREVIRHLQSDTSTIDDREIKRRMYHVGSIIEPTGHRISIVQFLTLTNMNEFSGKICRRLEIASPTWHHLNEIDLGNLDEVSKLAIREIKNL